jgi:serine/threonine-protein kinase
LSALLDRKTLTVEEAIQLGIDILAGVQVLHSARVVHRDLKPGNILMRPTPGGGTRPVICDFGLSRLVKNPQRSGDSLSGPSLTGLTKGDVAMGTVKYMAPEQLLNARQATEQSDLYAVGAILHRAVTGFPPFGELDSPHEIARAKVIGEAPLMDCGRTDTTGRGFLRIVSKAVRRRPGERHTDAASMRAELEKLAELVRIGEGETQKTPGAKVAAAPSESPSSPVKRSPLILAAGALLIFGAGVTTGRIWTGDRIRIDVIASAAPPSAMPPPQTSLAKAAPTEPPPLKAPPAELVMPPTILQIAAPAPIPTPPAAVSASAAASASAKPVTSVAVAAPPRASASAPEPASAAAPVPVRRPPAADDNPY